MLGLSYAIRLSPRIEKRLATLFTPSPSRVGHPGDPYNVVMRSRSVFLIISRVTRTSIVRSFTIGTIRREIKRMLNTDVPYSPPAGLLEPKPEPVEELHGDYCFMYKEEDAFVQGD